MLRPSRSLVSKLIDYRAVLVSLVPVNLPHPMPHRSEHQRCLRNSHTATPAASTFFIKHAPGKQVFDSIR